MRHAVLVPLLAALSCPLFAAPPPEFTVVDIGAAPDYPGGRSGAFSINDRGQVIGGNHHAFLWDRGKTKDLGSLPPEGPEDTADSVAYGINNHGQIVGSSGSFGPIFMSGLQFARGILYKDDRLRQFTQKNASFIPYGINDKGRIVGLNGYRGFLYDNGKLIAFGTLSKMPEGNRSEARGINDRGQVTGWSTVGKGKPLADHAFLWQRGLASSRMRDLGTLPSDQSSRAYGINDKGQAVGFSSSNAACWLPDAHIQACFWQGGRVRGLGVLPGGRNSEALGINNGGRIVGWSEINHPLHSPAGDRHAFLWRGNILYDLNALIPAASGWVVEEARAINNKGQIVGSGRLNGQPHAFLLTPAGTPPAPAE